MSTNWSARKWLSDDVWFFETQLWLLADNNWKAILLHTGIFVEKSTQWTWRETI